MDHTVGGDDIRLGDFGVIYHDLDLASAVVRTSLGNLRRGFGPTSSAPSLVVATPTAQMHELGALIVAMIAASDRWRVTYLGPSLPAEEIAGAAHQSQARAVALSLVYPGDDPFLRGQLVKLPAGVSRGGHAPGRWAVSGCVPRGAERNRCRVVRISDCVPSVVGGLTFA